MIKCKPLGTRNYGSIPHLPGSRMGPADRHCHEGQATIATEQVRDKNDEVLVQEKLDGSNVGVARIDGQLYPLGRAGYLASSSPFEQHHLFASWVFQNADRFMHVLKDGERLVGEWLALAHGTIYQLNHAPFVAFDLMNGNRRMPYDEFCNRVSDLFTIPQLIHRGGPFLIKEALVALGDCGYHGAQEAPEGAIWRVERDRPTGVKGEKKRTVDFLVKYVRPDKQDGKYLPEISGNAPIWNWRP